MQAIRWDKLLHGIKLSNTPVWFRVHGQSEAMAEALGMHLPYQLKGGILDDPIAALVRGENVPGNALSQQVAATKMHRTSPHFRTICSSSHVFHNAGATATQEIALLLGSLAEQYDALTDAGILIERLIPKTMLSVSVGTSYFTEIAKFPGSAGRMAAVSVGLSSGATAGTVYSGTNFHVLPGDGFALY